MNAMRLGFLVLIMAICGVVNASDVYKTLLENEHLQHASIGVHIVDVDTREVIASYDAQRAFVPASVAKVVTAASVMKCYDDSMRWYTQVDYTGHIDNGVLHGDLIIKGKIDPSLGHQRSLQPADYFVEMMGSSLKRAAIKRITGNIIIDSSCSEMGGWSDWMLEDVGAYYGVPCMGLNYRGNTYNLFVRTGSEGTQPHILGASEYAPDIEYRNFMQVGERDSSFVISHPFSLQTVLMGKVPAHRDTFTLRCANTHPSLSLAYDIETELSSSGIVLEGDITCQYPDLGQEISRPHTTTLYAHPSDSLRAMLSTVMRYSDNLYAEALLRYISLTENSVATVASAIDKQRNIWQQEGLDVSGLNVQDGCGLSRKSTITPHFLASLLVDAYHDKQLGMRYVTLFPTAGKEGSVRSFTSRKPLPGLLRLKSGSMAGVLCYAGYYIQGAKTYAVVLMCNNHTCRNTLVRGCYERFLHQVFASQN